MQAVDNQFSNDSCKSNLNSDTPGPRRGSEDTTAEKTIKIPCRLIIIYTSFTADEQLTPTSWSGFFANFRSVFTLSGSGEYRIGLSQATSPISTFGYVKEQHSKMLRISRSKKCQETQRAGVNRQPGRSRQVTSVPEAMVISSSWTERVEWRPLTILTEFFYELRHSNVKHFSTAIAVSSSKVRVANC